MLSALDGLVKWGVTLTLVCPKGNGVCMTEVSESLQTDDKLEELSKRIDTLSEKIDLIGQQNDWLCENLQSLFLFVQQVGSNGGGIRGLLSAMKQGPSLTTNESPIEAIKVED